ncbi:hypothetical protein [Streptosporangium sp. NPDC048865]
MRLFPRVEVWFNAQARTWPGVARILSAPLALLVLVVVFRDTIHTVYQP